jgi:hypothetical protein
MARKPKTPPEPPGRVKQAYENAPGKPILHNGCPWCGLLDYRHTPSCPNRESNKG